jgi:hypothetical protein
VSQNVSTFNLAADLQLFENAIKFMGGWWNLQTGLKDIKIVRQPHVSEDVSKRKWNRGIG